MSVQRKEPSAEGLALAFSECLKPGKYGVPLISQRFGSMDGSKAGFVVTSGLTGETYRVTVEALS